MLEIEENNASKTYSLHLSRRLLSYLRPFPLTVTVILFSLIIATLAEVSLPLILRNTIDNYLIRTYVRIDYTSLNENADSLDILSNGIKIGNAIFMRSDKADFQKNTHLNKIYWYVFRIESDALQNLVNADKDSFKLDSNSPYAAIKTDKLKTFPEEKIVLIREADKSGLVSGTFHYIALLFVVLIFSFIQFYQSSKAAQKIMVNIRQKMLSHIMRQSMNFLGRTPVGSLVSRTANDVETINEFFTNVTVSFLKDIALIIGVIFAIFALDSSLALISVLLMLPTAAFMMIFRNHIRNAFRYVRLKLSTVNTYLAEHIGGMTTVQLFTMEKKSMSEFRHISRNLLSAHLKQIRLLSFFRPMIDFMASIIIALIIWHSASLHEQGTVSLGLLIAYIELIQKFFQPLKDIAEKFNILQSAMAGAERIFELMDGSEQIPDKNHLAEIVNPKGNIRFADVNFSYKNNQTVLGNFNLQIEAGSIVGIVGRTGSGKSTISNLLTRLWDINSGKIMLDGQDIRNLSLSSLRKTIVPIQQEAFLFSGTVKNNIDPGHKLTTKEVIDIAKFAESHQFIEKLPQGYQTNISEGGINLSAGQRQLIAFTRIIVSNPPVVILDEATANIDSETEQLIQSSLKKLLQGRTAIIIAHRLSTIQNADKIIVLDKGEIMEEGRHDELLSLKGLYSRMYEFSSHPKN